LAGSLSGGRSAEARETCDESVSNRPKGSWRANSLSPLPKGGRVVAQAPERWAFHGMPKGVIEGGHADLVVPLGRMAEAIRSTAARA